MPCAAPRQIVALGNAVGTTAGIAVLVMLILQRPDGISWIKESFPSMFAEHDAGSHPAIAAYGGLGCAVVSARV